MSDVSLSLDETLALLADSDRRAVVGYFRDADDATVTVDELAAGPVADERSDCSETDRLAMTLHHVHVPKLADAGVVDYDARNREVRYWGSERLETWHEHIRNLCED